jgi:hypothetical protein
MMPESVIGVMLCVMVCVGAILALGQYIGLRRDLRERGPERILLADFRFDRGAAIVGRATALHGHLDLEGLRRYYYSI